MSNQYTVRLLVKPIRKLPDGTIEITLTKGMTSVIDEIDVDLANLNWNTWTNGSIYYARRCIDLGKRKVREIRLHQAILERMIGRPLIKGEMVDHADGDGLNNCRNNLRLATHTQNMANKRRPKNNKSGYKGVFWLKSHNKWRAEIARKGKKIFLGYFDTPEEGYEAYIKAAIEHDGEFVRFE